MQQFAIMCVVSFETEVYVDAENLPEAMETLKEGFGLATYEKMGDYEEKFTPLDFIKPQVWCKEAQDYVPCNVVMFPVKEEITDEMEFEGED